MRKLLLRIIGALLALSVLVAVGCSQEAEPMNETTKAPEAATEETTDAPAETAAEARSRRDPEDMPLINPNAKARGDISYLAIGHSLNVNATYYLYDFLKEAGYENVEVAVLYYSGCSLQQHFDFFRKDEPAYRLYYNGKGNWVITEGYTMDMALRMKQWDYISFNTGVAGSAIPNSLEPHFTEVEKHVRQFQPNAHFFWNSFWAMREEGEYQERFRERYSGGTQIDMYNDILDTTRVAMRTHPDMEFLVPEGTAIQNMRTSRYGDGPLLIRDGGHLSYSVGYYLGAIVLAKSIADIDIDASTFIPEEFREEFTDEVVHGLKAAAKDAFADPWHVTENPYQ